MSVFLKIRESCDRFKDRPALEMLLNDGTFRTYTYWQLRDNIAEFFTVGGPIDGLTVMAPVTRKRRETAFL